MHGGANEGAGLEAVIAVARPWMRPDGPDDAETIVPLLGLLDELRTALPWVIEPDTSTRCPLGMTSVWSKSLFAALVAGPALAALSGEEAPTSSPVLVFVDGKPTAMRCSAPPRFAGEPAFDGFSRYVETILCPTVLCLSEASGLGPRLFWSNAATMLAYLWESWSKIPMSAERAVRMRREVLDAPVLPGSTRPNPFCDHIRYVPSSAPGYETGTRQRRICCLRDRLGQSLCASCPKISATERDALLVRASKAKEPGSVTVSSRRPR